MKNIIVICILLFLHGNIWGKPNIDSTSMQQRINYPEYIPVLSAFAGVGFERTIDVGVRYGFLFPSNIYAGVVGSFQSLTFGNVQGNLLRFLFVGIECGYELRLPRSQIIARPFISVGAQGIGHDILSIGTTRFEVLKNGVIPALGGGLIVGYKSNPNTVLAIEARAVVPMPIAFALHYSYQF